MYIYYTNLKKIRDFVGKTLININKSKIMTIEMIFFLENRFVILYLNLYYISTIYCIIIQLKNLKIGYSKIRAS